LDLQLAKDHAIVPLDRAQGEEESLADLVIGESRDELWISLRPLSGPMSGRLRRLDPASLSCFGFKCSEQPAV
jgi:hypothetical protein